MPSLKNYDLFISHAWTYGDDYTKLVNLLDNASNFKYRNYSAPEHKPIIPAGTKITQKELTAKIENKIKPVNIVLVLSGMYATYRDWIQVEIDVAQKYNKPIIGITPRGQERIPQVVQNAATCMVGWNTDSIVSAIRTNAI